MGRWPRCSPSKPIKVVQRLHLTATQTFALRSRQPDPPWADTTVLSGDVADAIRELKSQRDGELQVHGSGALVRWLLDAHLVDELTLVTVPVIVGQGTRLFPGKGPDIAVEPVDSRITTGGVIVHSYRPTGRPTYTTAANS